MWQEVNTTLLLLLQQQQLLLLLLLLLIIIMIIIAFKSIPLSWVEQNISHFCSFTISVLIHIRRWVQKFSIWLLWTKLHDSLILLSYISIKSSSIWHDSLTYVIVTLIYPRLYVVLKNSFWLAYKILVRLWRRYKYSGTRRESN